MKRVRPWTGHVCTCRQQFSLPLRRLPLTVTIQSATLNNALRLRRRRPHNSPWPPLPYNAPFPYHSIKVIQTRGWLATRGLQPLSWFVLRTRFPEIPYVGRNSENKDLCICLRYCGVVSAATVVLMSKHHGTWPAELFFGYPFMHQTQDPFWLCFRFLGRAKPCYSWHSKLLRRPSLHWHFGCCHHHSDLFSRCVSLLAA